MTSKEQYKAWLEKVYGMMNVYNEIPKSDDVETPTDGVMFPNPLDTLKGKPEPGRAKPISVPEGVDYYERLIRDYLKDRQEINISKLKGIRDTIDHPPHYTSGKIEVWDFIIDQGLDFLLGNVIKYVCRAGRKGKRLEDLRKAEAYIRKAIKNEGGSK